MTSSDDQLIDKAVQLLNNGDVVAMPTETVYGLAARIDSVAAIKKIFAIKERPFFDPLIVHVSSKAQAMTCTKNWNPMADLLSEAFWPGALTLVLPKSEIVSDLITSGLESVGLRWPKHPMAQALIQKAKVPLAAPSANKFGRTSPTKSRHVTEEFGDAVFVLEGEASQIGIESTVLSVKFVGGVYELSILRKGAILFSQLESAVSKSPLNYKWVEVADKSESPGHMKHHYMPSVPLVICRNTAMKLAELTVLLNQKLPELPDTVEGVKIIKPAGKISKIEFLRLSAEPELAARELYSQLRSASLRKPEVLCFIQTSAQTGEMWESIFDRLYKAASLILE